MVKSKTMGSSDRFSYEWVRYCQIIPEYEAQFLKWVTPLRPQDFKGRTVLDAGCGIGRNSFWPLKYGAGKVVAFDIDKNTVSVARKNLLSFKNAEIRLQSIYDIDWSQRFDITFCIGVLHHLENPKKAIDNLIKATKKGGKVVCWVYGFHGNEWVVKCINPIRFFTSRIPPGITNIVAYLFSIPLFIFLKTFPQHKSYLMQLKNFHFWHIHSIVLDQLLPKIANYWTKKEVKKLFSNPNFKSVKIYPVHAMSWSVIGIKA